MKTFLAYIRFKYIPCDVLMKEVYPLQMVPHYIMITALAHQVLCAPSVNTIGKLTAEILTKLQISIKLVHPNLVSKLVRSATAPSLSRFFI